MKGIERTIASAHRQLGAGLPPTRQTKITHNYQGLGKSIHKSLDSIIENKVSYSGLTINQNNLNRMKYFQVIELLPRTKLKNTKRNLGSNRANEEGTVVVSIKATVVSINLLAA